MHRASQEKGRKGDGPTRTDRREGTDKLSQVSGDGAAEDGAGERRLCKLAVSRAPYALPFLPGLRPPSFPESHIHVIYRLTRHIRHYLLFTLTFSCRGKWVTLYVGTDNRRTLSCVGSRTRRMLSASWNILGLNNASTSSALWPLHTVHMPAYADE